MDGYLHSDADNFELRDRQGNRLYCELPRPNCVDPAWVPCGKEQSRLRLILIGYPEDVSQEILNLYHCGYEVNGWSPPQVIPTTGEVVRVYTKRARRLGY